MMEFSMSLGYIGKCVLSFSEVTDSFIKKSINLFDKYLKQIIYLVNNKNELIYLVKNYEFNFKNEFLLNV